jgi:hypothetical protein
MFSGHDVRVEIVFPGSIRRCAARPAALRQPGFPPSRVRGALGETSYLVEPSGMQVAMRDIQWGQTHVSAVLRALSCLRTGMEQTESRLEATLLLDPLAESNAVEHVIAAAAQVCHARCTPPPQRLQLTAVPAFPPFLPPSPSSWYIKA